MKFKNWPETKQAFVDRELRICGELTATNIDGVPVLIITPSPDELKKAVEGLGISWSPIAHKPATVAIPLE